MRALSVPAELPDCVDECIARSKGRSPLAPIDMHRHPTETLRIQIYPSDLQKKVAVQGVSVGAARDPSRTSALAQQLSPVLARVLLRWRNAALHYGADGCAAARGGTTLSPIIPPRRFAKGEKRT